MLIQLDGNLNEIYDSDLQFSKECYLGDNQARKLWRELSYLQFKVDEYGVIQKACAFMHTYVQVSG